MDFWFSKKRCEQCARIENTLEADERESEKIIEQEDLSSLIADADAIFSQYIRLKYADEYGIVKCYTCDTKKHWSMMQNGHFIKRGHLRLRHDERHCRPQDAHCNEHLGGNLVVFRQRLNEEYNGLPDILEEEMRLVHKPSREELKQIIAQYTPLVKQMKAKIKPTK